MTIFSNKNGLLRAASCAVGVTVVIATALWLLLTTRDFSEVAYPVVFLVCAIVSVVVARRAYGDLVSPVALMALGWMGPVGLYSLDLSPVYLARFRADTWWIVIGTLLLFNLGCAIAIGSTCRLEAQREREGGSKKGDAGPKQTTAWGDYVLYAYFVLGVSSWVYRVWALGGLSGIILLSDEPDVVRWQELPRVVGQMPIFLLVVPLLCLVRWENEGFKKRRFLWLLAAIALATCILDTARSNIYQAVFVAILFWTLRRGKVPLKGLTAVATCCLLFFVLVSWQRFRAAGPAAEQIIDEVGILRPLALPYVYLTSSLANVQLNVDEGRANFEGGGVRMLMPILSWLQVFKPEQIGNYLSDWPGGISLYQADLWIDFGWTGLLLGPLALGLICGWAYRRWRLRDSSFNAMIYAVLGTAVIASGFVNWFNSPVTWFFMFLILPALWTPRNLGSKSVLREEALGL